MDISNYKPTSYEYIQIRFIKAAITGLEQNLERCKVELSTLTPNTLQYAIMDSECLNVLTLLEYYKLQLKELTK